jgi:hypothetical protein
MDATIVVTAAQVMLARMTQEVADRWEPYHLTDQQKNWFGDQRSGNGACCDTADGVPAADWERRLDPDGTQHYWVAFDVKGADPPIKWLKVPDMAVLTHGNPVGVPIVWWMAGSGNIRCFVPGPEN